MHFYTNFVRHKGKLLVREIKDGARNEEKLKIEPTLYAADPKGEYSDVHGHRLSPIKQDDVWAAKEFVEKMGKVADYHVSGMTSWPYPMVNELYPGEIEFDVDAIVVAYIDIEVAMKGAKPNVDTADQEVLSIAVKIGNETHVFSCLPYDGDGTFNYVRCADESDLLDRFLGVWASRSIDVVTGWYIDLFDIPYLVNRIRKILGKKAADRLSPWGIIEERTVTSFGRENTTYNIVGMSVIDYKRAYQKFTYKKKESYRLDFIAGEEKVGRKLDYSEIGDLNDLYAKDPTKYIDYNVMDIVLVQKLDDKLKLLELIYTVAYYCKITYDDVFGTVKMWEALIHNHLMAKKIVVPTSVKAEKRSFEGGFVKAPLLGLHRWVVSFDFDSLYPHIVMALNISSDTIAGELPRKLKVEDFMDGVLDSIRDYVGDNECVAASGVKFNKDHEGFFPEIMKSLYVRRSAYKKDMIKAKKNKEQAKTEEEKKKYDKEAARLNALQLALKYALNSGYGAMSNEYFLWFDMALAESITLSGQLAIQFTERDVNRYLNWACGTTDVDYVIAMDTDSMYVTLDAYVQKEFPGRSVAETTDFVDKFCEETMTPIIRRSTNKLGKYLNAYDASRFSMKRETIADVGIWTAKKKYALRALDVEGVRFENPEIKSTGLEVVKSSTPAVVRDELKEMIKIILDGDQAKLQERVKEFEARFNKMRFEEIAEPRGVGDITDYVDERRISAPLFGDASEYVDANGYPGKGCPEHMRAAITYNRMLKLHGLESKYPSIQPGDGMKFAALKMPNPTNEPVISCIDILPPEFGLEPYVDYAAQFDKAFLKPLYILLNVMGWSHKKRSSLSSFYA